MKTMLIRLLRAMEKQGHTGAILIKSEKKFSEHFGSLEKKNKKTNVCPMQWKGGKFQFQVAPFVTDVWT